MAQLTVRKVPPEIVRLLKLRAAEHARSAEAEHRAILEEALGSPEDFWLQARTLREATRGRGGSDSVEILREDRLRDWEP